MANQNKRGQGANLSEEERRKQQEGEQPDAGSAGGQVGDVTDTSEDSIGGTTPGMTTEEDDTFGM